MYNQAPYSNIRSLPPYPDGWFLMCPSKDIKPGKIKIVQWMGRELVVYRTRSGEVRVTEPYCPHLGAHLGHGGVVEDEEIVCPFHKYAFDKQGSCVRTGHGHRPPKIKLGLQEAREVYGGIFVWHHAHAGPPCWELPPIDLNGYSGSDYNLIPLRGHVQDMNENGVDDCHFKFVHKWKSATYAKHHIEGHILHTELSGYGGMALTVKVKCYGLGLLIGQTNIPKLGIDVYFFICGTMTTASSWNLRFSAWFRLDKPRIIPESIRYAMGFALAWTANSYNHSTLRQDKPIWNNRAQLQHPGLSAADAPIGVYRRWSQQFYSSDIADATIPAVSSVYEDEYSG